VAERGKSRSRLQNAEGVPMASRHLQAVSVQWNPQKRLPRERPPTTPLLRVEVQGGDIVVTASGTDYVVTYHKPAASWLTDFSIVIDVRELRRTLSWNRPIDCAKSAIGTYQTCSMR
jgi:hypothetical protein